MGGLISAFLPIIMICIYCFVCYINFRIVVKFDKNTNVLENLIPIWNTYILAKQVISRPGLYIGAMIMIPVVSGLVMLQLSGWSFPTGQTMGKLQDISLFFDVLKFIEAILTAYLWGEVAKCLGKKCWLHRIMGFFYFPLIITVPIMAFDSSRSVNKNLK